MLKAIQPQLVWRMEARLGEEMQVDFGLGVPIYDGGRPYRLQHKGKVERGVGYLRTKALKGRRFKSLSEGNLFLQQWESQVADAAAA